MANRPGTSAALIFVTCPASSANTTADCESDRMNRTSPSAVAGYTVVVAAPAQLIARSARIHSMRVVDAMATRCSTCTPSATNPAARSNTRSLVCFQVSEVQPPASG